jgi:mannose/cellobiose epimerase-like protein (N-acyl-D-glucosamine 2-epimerase family)
MIDIENLYRRYRGLLLDDVVPFWFRHGTDRTHGGVITCMDDDGTLVSGDKFIWSQARSVWTFSALYNRVEKRPDRNVILEFLTTGYEELPPPAGTFVMPGHAIESMWFVMHVAERQGDKELIRRAAEVMRRHMEFGWDEKSGGIFLSRDIEGHPPYLPHSEMKVWWPHAEAIYPTLLAHHWTGKPWWLEWHQKVADWTWAHFPAPEFGEWRQRLDREGKPSTEIVALPEKDPFHLPRGIILILQLLERMQADQAGLSGVGSAHETGRQE